MSAANDESKPIELLVVFRQKKVTYQYSVVIKKNRIESENLYEISASEVRTTRKLLFSKELVSGSYRIKTRNEFVKSSYESIAKKDHGTTSLLTIAAFQGETIPLNIVSYWNNTRSNVGFGGRFAPFGYHAYMALRRMSKKKRIPKSFETLDKTILNFDPDKGVFTHEGKDGEFKLEVEQESSGT